jgi:RNA-directed DNA polymerase
VTLIDRIASDLRLPSQYVQLVAYTASHRYKTYLIAKNRGGSRRIDHPARELKLFQRWLVNNIFSRLPVHKAARI